MAITYREIGFSATNEEVNHRLSRWQRSPSQPLRQFKDGFFMLLAESYLASLLNQAPQRSSGNQNILYQGLIPLLFVSVQLIVRIYV